MGWWRIDPETGMPLANSPSALSKPPDFVLLNVAPGVDDDTEASYLGDGTWDMASKLPSELQWLLAQDSFGRQTRSGDCSCRTKIHRASGVQKCRHCGKSWKRFGRTSTPVMTTIGSARRYRARSAGFSKRLSSSSPVTPRIRVVGRIAIQVVSNMASTFRCVQAVNEFDTMTVVWSLLSSHSRTYIASCV